MGNKAIKKLLKICAFICIVNLPFITVAQLLGIDTFLDSFGNHDYYQYFKSSNLDVDDMSGDYIVLQKTSHPDFSVIKGDKIFYLKDEGGLMCRTVHQVSKNGAISIYYIINPLADVNDEPVSEYQIIGKVVSFIDDNIWNSLSLKVWDLSINNLNAAALFTN